MNLWRKCLCLNQDGKTTHCLRFPERVLDETHKVIQDESIIQEDREGFDDLQEDLEETE